MPWNLLILFLSLGLGFSLWKLYQVHQQLKQILNLLSGDNTKISSLSVSSLVRREINQLNYQCQQLEHKLQNSQKLLEIVPIGYLHIDEENQLLWCNQQAQQLLNLDRWQPGQVRLLLELIRSYELDQLIEETRNSQKPQLKEWTLYGTNYHSQGKKVGTESLFLKAYSWPLPQKEVGVFLENKQPLIELSQSRDRAFSDLTHELRTPLTSIRLVAENLEKRLKEPESRWITQMLKEVKRLINLVQDWLEISQLQENPNQQINYQSVDLNKLIFSVWEILKPLAKAKEIDLNYSGSEKICLEADQARLTQVFLNLFDNAIKHSPNQSIIKFEVELIPKNGKHEPNLLISVIDSGSGFSELDLPYVFDRLYRGDTSRMRQSSEIELPETSLRPHGSGLGLAIVKQIIQAHHGSIIAKNHPQTGGAWLEIKIPIAKPTTH
jgi:two-component system phosphate regulon sensor histidine kinase PhoR